MLRLKILCVKLSSAMFRIAAFVRPVASAYPPRKNWHSVASISRDVANSPGSAVDVTGQPSRYRLDPAARASVFEVVTEVVVRPKVCEPATLSFHSQKLSPQIGEVG